MKKTIIVTVFVCFGLAVLWSCGDKKEEKAKTEGKTEIVAKVGDYVITADEFKQEMMRRGGFYREKTDKKTILDDMIKEEVLFIKAEQLGLDKDPDVRRLYRNILVSKLREKQIRQQLDGMKPTKEELQSYYDKNVKRYTIPARVRLAQILMTTEPGMPDSQVAELKNKMEQCRKKALAGKESGQGFGQLAADYSKDVYSRGRGGELGWFEEGRGYPTIDPVALSAGFALKTPGQISDIITTSKGLYLLKLMDRRPEQVIPFTSMQGRIQQEILAEKRITLEKSLSDEVSKSLKIETFPKVLETIKISRTNQRPGMFREGQPRPLPYNMNVSPHPPVSPHPSAGMQAPVPGAPSAPAMKQKPQPPAPSKAEEKTPATSKHK